ncbi:hypothetical protein ABZ281_41660 [Streptomyces sp. NPDC006265]|uniref:hypothetical protein n=1 Tax=Streptomyces sp. NPDC006265 TaxID=3156740 RepID=UPI0033BF1061
MTDQHTDIADGLTPERRAHVIRGRAENHVPNPGYDQILADMAKDPGYADTLTPHMRLALATYANDKAAHDDLNN